MRWAFLFFGLLLPAVVCSLGADTAGSRIRFRDVAGDAGLRFTLENCPTPQKQMIETMPGGIAVFDYDNDGRPDIFFTNGADVGTLKKNSPKYYNRLFRNESNLHFRDVTGSTGVAGDGYSMGVVAGDFDNDGNVDLFVTGVLHNSLLHNLGNGRFEDVTARSGIKSDEWSVAAAWFDFDNDGLLDLLVVTMANGGPGSINSAGTSHRTFAYTATRSGSIHARTSYTATAATARSRMFRRSRVLRRRSAARWALLWRITTGTDVPMHS